MGLICDLCAPLGLLPYTCVSYFETVVSLYPTGNIASCCQVEFYVNCMFARHMRWLRQFRQSVSLL